jgi:hypothetical protein
MAMNPKNSGSGASVPVHAGGEMTEQTHAALVERLKELADRAERHQLKSEYSSHLLEAAQALQSTEGALQIYWRQQQALSAPPPGWQDIETAPKDGTDVLLGWFELPGMKIRRVGFWHDRENAWVEDHGVLHNQDSPPTHWMPLPAPPSPEGAAPPRVPNAVEVQPGIYVSTKSTSVFHEGAAPPPATRDAVRVLEEVWQELTDGMVGGEAKWLEAINRGFRKRLAALRTEGEGAPR